MRRPAEAPWRNAVALSNMPRHVALIGEARLESDLRKGSELPRRSATARSTRASMSSDAANARRAGEGPAEMEGLRPAMSAIARC